MTEEEQEFARLHQLAEEAVDYFISAVRQANRKDDIAETLSELMACVKEKDNMVILASTASFLACIIDGCAKATKLSHEEMTAIMLRLMISSATAAHAAQRKSQMN